MSLHVRAIVHLRASHWGTSTHARFLWSRLMLLLSVSMSWICFRNAVLNPLYVGKATYSNKEKFSVTNTGTKPLERLVREAVQISNTHPTQIINGRTEYIRPVIQRMAHVDLLDDDRVRGHGAWQLIDRRSFIFKAIFVLEFFNICEGVKNLYWVTNQLKRVLLRHWKAFWNVIIHSFKTWVKIKFRNSVKV